LSLYKCFFLQPIYIFNFLVQLWRTPQVYNLWRYFQINNLFVFSLLGNTYPISLLGLSIIIFIIVFSLIILVVFLKWKPVSKDGVVLVIMIFYMCLPLAFLTTQVRYFYWFFPLCCLFISKNLDFKRVKSFSITITLISVGFGIICLFTSSLQTFIDLMYNFPPDYSLGLNVLLPSDIFFTLIVILWEIFDNSMQLIELAKNKPTFLQYMLIPYFLFTLQIYAYAINDSNMLQIALSIIILTSVCIYFIFFARTLGTIKGMLQNSHIDIFLRNTEGIPKSV